MTNIRLKSKLLYIATTLVLAIFFIIDRLLKNLAMRIDQDVEIISNILYFSLTKNYYISFSIPLSGILLNIAISVLVILLLLYIIYLIIGKKSPKLEIFLLLAMFLGALSNIIDRLSLGFVIDYIEIRHFSALNLADILISVSAIWLIIGNIRKGR